MIRGRRKEDRVRELLTGPYPSVPADLGAAASALGSRRLRRRVRARRAAGLVVLVLLTTAIVWLAVTQPWTPEPVTTTPRW